MRPNLRVLRHHWHLVYKLPSEWNPKRIDEQQAELVWADAASVRYSFRHHAKLKRRFLKFLSRGCIGLFLVLDNRWAAYAWMTRPKTALPAHLPPAASLNAGWIFHCRTLHGYQRRGLYKYAITMLASRARTEGVDVYIDTQPDNLPSRSAIISVGFEPWGSVRVWTIQLPGWRIWRGGSWHPEEPHPAASGRIKIPSRTETVEQYPGA